MAKLSKKVLFERVGGLSRPSKMPGYSFSISALNCITGGRLVNKPGSVCEGCYALKGRYAFPNVQAAANRRHGIYDTSKTWRDDMVAAIRATGDDVFRVFDGGDLQSLKMLRDWVAVAEQLPEVRFWLPTKEYGFVKAFLKLGGVVPKNMVIRISQPMVEDLTPHKLTQHEGVTGSGVTKGAGWNCPSPNQENQCKACRKCWDRGEQFIIYKWH